MVEYGVRQSVIDAHGEGIAIMTRSGRSEVTMVDVNLGCKKAKSFVSDGKRKE